MSGLPPSNTGAYEKFGPFTAQEVQSAFQSFDLDHNGYVGASELRAIYSSLGEEITDEEIDEMIHLVDTDGDGQINRKEFQQMIFKYAGQIEPMEKIKNKKSTNLLSPVKSPKTGLEESSRPPKSPNSAMTEFSSIPAPSVQSPSHASSANPPSVPVFSLLESKTRHRRLRDLLEKANFLDSSENLSHFLLKYQDIDLEIDNEEFSYTEFLDYFSLEDRSSLKELFLFFTFSHRRPSDENEQIASGNGKESLINVRFFLVSIMIYSDFPPEDMIAYGFAIFDRDRAGTLLEEDLSDFLQSLFLADFPQSMGKKVQSIMRHSENPKKGEISLEELIQVQRKFPALILPDVQ